MGEAYIFDALRTPRGRGRKGGALNEVSPIDLVVTVLAAIRERNSLDTSRLDDVILGCVSPIGEQGSNIARIGAIHAGFDQSVAGVQINRFCSSGLEACNMAAAQIMAGQSDLVIGGGVEAMSRVPMGSSGGPWSTDPDVAFHSYFTPQGIGADAIATIWGYKREDCDRFALKSQKRAGKAWDEGRFSGSVIPVKDMNGLLILDHDEHMRPETSLEDLAALKPSFAEIGKNAGFDDVLKMRYPEIEFIDHVHHAGNSSGVVDGAAAVLIGSGQAGEALGLKARARFISFASIGSEPTIMLTGPAPSAQKALARAGMTPGDIDLWEINEAFASVALRFMDAMRLDDGNVNVNGGAIAMGHPLGATGAIILGSALDELERSGKSTALVTLCVGGGMGTATIIERV